MGLTSDQMPPSEALPDIRDHSLIFHNGKGYYYSCKDYSHNPEKRLFECVVPGCDVTASMGSGLGAPLIDNSSHVHASDITYREKCILLHTIRQRFLQEGTSIFFVLQEALSSLPLIETEADVTCDFESIKIEEPSLEMEEIKEEHDLESIEEVTVPVGNDEDNYTLCGGREMDENDYGNSLCHDIVENELLLDLNNRSLEIKPVKQTYSKKTTSGRKRKSPKPSTSHSYEPAEVASAEECMADSGAVAVFPKSDDQESTSLDSKQSQKRKLNLQVRKDLESPPKKGLRSGPGTLPINDVCSVLLKHRDQILTKKKRVVKFTSGIWIKLSQELKNIYPCTPARLYALVVSNIQIQNSLGIVSDLSSLFATNEYTLVRLPKPNHGKAGANKNHNTKIQNTNKMSHLIGCSRDITIYKTIMNLVNIMKTLDRGEDVPILAKQTSQGTTLLYKNPPLVEENKLCVRKSCQECPSQKNRKTRFFCGLCKTYLCVEHIQPMCKKCVSWMF